MSRSTCAASARSCSSAASALASARSFSRARLRAVVVIHALELENLDLNEFQAVVDDMSMAVAKHHNNLARFAPSAANAAS